MRRFAPVRLPSRLGARYNQGVSRSDAGTYLYVKDGAQPRAGGALPERRTLGLTPPRPDEPAARLRLVRPVLHAQRCDPLLSMIHCPDSPLGDAIRAAAAPLEEAEGPLIVSGTPGAPIGRIAIELAAALVETGGFAAIIDAGVGLARVVGVDRFDGLLAQTRQRARDEQRPLELLYLTWRCGLLPIEFDQTAGAEDVQAALDTTTPVCSRSIVAAPPPQGAGDKAVFGLGGLVLVTTPDGAADGRLATAITAAAGNRILGVIVAPEAPDPEPADA